MMKPGLLVLFLFLFIISTVTLGQNETCVPVIKPQLSEKTQKDFENKLTIAKADYLKDSLNANNIIWYGRRTAYLGDYEEAIRIFSKGITLHPSDARFYRHRGHRYITLRCFDKAIRDFKKAVNLVKGKADEIEPDGLPNARNIPTSSLQSNIWYHLGLAYFLNGEYRKAFRAYKHCLALKLTGDMRTATVNWAMLILLKFGKITQARYLSHTVCPNAEVIENIDYFKLVCLYPDKPDLQSIDYEVKTLLAGDSTSLRAATIYFAIGFYCFSKGYSFKAAEYFKKAIRTGQWSSFGYIAAEAELSRMKNLESNK